MMPSFLSDKPQDYKTRRHTTPLPNPLWNLLCAAFEGRGGRLKYYGLPVEPPPDRHRWFFGHDEAVEFLRGRAHLNGFEVEQIDAEEGFCPPWPDDAGQNVLNHPNMRGGTIWCVLRRAGSGGPK